MRLNRDTVKVFKMFAVIFLVSSLIVSLLYATYLIKNDTDSIVMGSSQDSFVEIESNHSWKIVYHKRTGVMYAVSNGKDNKGIFTLLVNPDGTPMTYE